MRRIPAETLTAGLRVMDSDHEDDFVDLRRNHIQFDDQGFIITIALAGAVVAGMGDRTVR